MRLDSIFFLGILLMNPPFALGVAKSRMELPALIGDHMVLQQGRAAVWGRDVPGQKVTVVLQDIRGVAKADSAGRWRVELPDPPPGGPYNMTIAGSSSVTIHDVCVGELWVGSGQSNMEMTLKETHDAPKRIAEAKSPMIRLFLQGHAMAEKPVADAQGRWVVCSPETAGDFPAAPYFFARALRKELDCPVGLLVAAWGGSFIESWMPRGAFEETSSGKKLLARWAQKTRRDPDLWNGGARRELELSNLRLIPRNPDQAPLPIAQGDGTQDPPAGSLGGFWKSDAAAGSSVTYSYAQKTGKETTPVGKFSGLLWGGAWGFIATQLQRDGTAVDLSAYSDLEFEARGDGQYFIFMPQPSITDGDNYVSASFQVTSRWKRHRVSLEDLKQSGWGTPRPRTREAVQGLAFGAVVPGLDSIPTVMYNGMIHPLTRYPVRGVIWYQGEANVGHAADYRRFLPQMIRSWREAWGQKELTFLIAQLPLFMDPVESPGESAWAEIREAQAMAVREPGVEMAVLLDLGEAKNIHPGNKREVGERLARVALRTAYEKPSSWSGPRFASMEVEGKKARIRFTEVGKGLRVQDGGPLRGFTVAGPDGMFRWAHAEIQGDSVLVWNDEIPTPQAVRYAWADHPVCNLFGKNGLPAAPFRTDPPVEP